MNESEIIERFARNLERLRKRKKISWLELGRRTGISRGQIWRIKNVLSFPELQTIAKILSVLNADIADLFFKER